MNTEDFGKLVLRLTLGVLLLFHGTHKVLDGIQPIRDMVMAHGLPGLLAYGVYLGEVVGPILVIFGLFARVGGLLIVANMIVAVALAGTGSLFALDNQGGYALELEAFYLFGGLAVALLGAGRFGLGGGRWN
jgi:putative oxidoreductase